MKVAFVCGGKAKVPAKPPSVNSPTDKIRVVDWENCFICKKKKNYPRNFKACSVLHLLTHKKLTKTWQSAL